MTRAVNFGKPINILTFSDANQAIINFSELDYVFKHPEIQDRKVVILSLVGAFRGGKSYLLDYSLRFLYGHYASIKNPDKTKQFIFEEDDSWMGDLDSPLDGFSWRSGSKRDTTGIIMWSDVFLHTITITREKIAIFVMDTQGLFDSESTPADNSRIFSLGTLMSSIQVLNIMNRIREDELQYLQFATEFTRFSTATLNNSKGKPFQNLIFLVRDWNNNDEYKYGVEGGEQYINDILKINPDQKSELRTVRETLRDSFEKIQCCLLPYPGKTVASNKKYDGRWSEMDDDFKVELKSFIEHILMPDNLLIKRVNTNDVTVSQMHQLNKEYLQLFSSNEVPQISSIHDLTVESYMKNLVEKCVKDYKLTFYRNADLITKENMPLLHEKCKERSLKLYEMENKMGTAEVNEKFKVKLEQEIEIFFKYLSRLTEKNFKEFEQESQRLYAELEREQEQRLDTELAIESIKRKIKELNEKKHEMEPEIYKKHSLMLKANEHAEQLKMERYEHMRKEEFDFRQALSIAAGVSVVVASIIAPSSFLAILSTINEVSMKVSTVAKSVDEACSNVKRVMDNFSNK